jgi:hypothetical protein
MLGGEGSTSEEGKELDGQELENDKGLNDRKEIEGMRNMRRGQEAIQQMRRHLDMYDQLEKQWAIEEMLGQPTTETGNFPIVEGRTIAS